MTCRDTERLWNELLDARGRPRPDLEAALSAHAATCPACEQVSARYRTLHRAIAAWVTSPMASPEFVERLRNVGSAGPVESIRWPRHSLAAWRPWLAAAAAIVVAGVLGVRLGWHAGPPAIGPPAASPRQSLVAALADATTATLELARETSGPAGRVGRVMLSSADLPTAEPPSWDGSLRLTAPDVLQSVGDRFEAGVGPLSGSARQAFGFLLRAPAPEPSSPQSGT